ncbi:MAG: hypothetical protein WKF84_00325 [Pyrinomonadaceae bacterium]
MDDPQIMFGYAVTGTVDPQKIMTNRGARVGDALILHQADWHRSDLNRH